MSSITLFPNIAKVEVQAAINPKEHRYYSGITIEPTVRDINDSVKDGVKIILCNGYPSKHPPVTTDWCETIVISKAQAKEFAKALLAAANSQDLAEQAEQ